MSDKPEEKATSTALPPSQYDELAHRKSTFHALRGVSVQDLITQIRYLPKEAQKHVGILSEARVNRAVNPAVQSQLDELKSLPDAEMSSKLEAFMPADVAERSEFLNSIASEQAHALSQLYDRSRRYKLRASEDRTYHTPSPSFMANLWTMPASQTPAMAAVPKERRQGWYDLTMHYLGVNAAEPHFKRLQECVAGTYPTSAGRNALRPAPCNSLNEAAKAQMQVISDEVTKGHCEPYAYRFHQQLVVNPDAERAGIEYQGLLQCVEVTRTLQAIVQATIHLRK
jgi:hypothetical protein